MKAASLTSLGPWRPYAAAFIAVAVSALARIWPLPELVGTRYPFFPFFPAIVLVSIYSGLHAGLAATALSCLVLKFGYPGLTQGIGWPAYGVFFATCLGLAALAETVRRSRDRERQRRRAHSNFVAMLAHEIKTPLAAIQMAAGALERGLEGEDAAARLGNVHRAVDDISAIIDRCIEADRIEHDDLRIAKSEFKLKDLLEEAASASSFPERIALDCSETLAVSTDPLLLRLIAVNLIDNALKYSPEHSRISVRCERENRTGRKGVNLRFANPAGPAGCPDPSRVFEKYYRTTDAQARSGAGLGLWLVKRIAESLSGQAGYHIRDGQVEFVIWMPL